MTGTHPGPLRRSPSARRGAREKRGIYAVARNFRLESLGRSSVRHEAEAYDRQETGGKIEGTKFRPFG